MTIFPVLYFLNPSTFLLFAVNPIPSGICKNVPCIYESVSVLLICLFFRSILSNVSIATSAFVCFNFHEHLFPSLYFQYVCLLIWSTSLVDSMCKGFVLLFVRPPASICLLVFNLFTFKVIFDIYCHFILYIYIYIFFFKEFVYF